jgi:hypothetical protein
MDGYKFKPSNSNVFVIYGRQLILKAALVNPRNCRKKRVQGKLEQLLKGRTGSAMPHW